MPGDRFDLIRRGHAVVAVGQPHRERERDGGGPRLLDDADPAHFDLAGQWPWRAAPQATALVPDVATVVGDEPRSEEHTSELQSLMRISYAVFCLKKKKKPNW